MKAVTYGLIGLIIGVALGAMIGSGNTYYTKKSQKEAEDAVQVPVWAIIGGLVCAVVGASLGSEVDREESGSRRKTTGNKGKSGGGVNIISETKASGNTPRKTPEGIAAYNRYWAEKNNKTQEGYKQRFEEEAKEMERLRKQQKTAKDPLGFGMAVTTFEGRGYQTTGVTKWVDNRNNREYELKSVIEYEMTGSGSKIKWYWLNIYLNSAKYTTINFNQHKHEGVTKEAFLRKTHQFYRDYFFKQAQYNYDENPGTDFLGLMKKSG